MSRKVIISSDSTCDLSPEIVRKYGVEIFPMRITDGETMRLDGIEINVQDVFNYAKSTGKLMKTSAANVAEYSDYFRRFDGCDVIHFSISSEISSTHNNAVVASGDFEGIHCIDSQLLSTGIGIMVVKACELRDKGKSADEIAEYIEQMKDRVEITFVIDTLEYLWKGGRCSGVTALGANILKLKPCIELKNGKMDVRKKYRGKVMEIFKTVYPEDVLADPKSIDTTRAFITHSVPECDHYIIDEVAEKMRSLVPFKEIIETHTGCTVSVHCGPYTLGIIFARKK